MQITDPPPTFAEMWDWRANVDKGKRKFDEALSAAINHPENFRTNQGFQDLVNNTNRWRQQSGLAPFQSVRVPGFTQQQINEDAVRGYNGYGKRDPLTRDPSLWLHEFTLTTSWVTIDGQQVRILEVRDLGGGIGEAQWRRVEPPERPQTVGDPNYIENVRKQKPWCP